MKNLNPNSGLRQAITGGYNVARKDIFDLIKEYKLSIPELGYYVLLFTVADWDKNENRYGYIRYELKDLLKMVEIPYSTLRGNIQKLIKKGVIKNVNSNLRITRFDWVDRSIMGERFRTKYDDEFLKNYFENSKHEYEKSQILGLEQQKSIRDSIKDEIKDNCQQNKVVVIRQEPRTDEEYKKLFEENPFFPLPKDMKWIDENAELRILITSDDQELDVVNQYFDGNMERYSKCLISGGVYGTM